MHFLVLSKWITGLKYVGKFHLGYSHRGTNVKEIKNIQDNSIREVTACGSFVKWLPVAHS